MAKGFHARDYKFDPTAIRFETADARLKEVFDRGETFLKNNEMTYNDRRVIKEGACYPYVWLETQPMGGEMYAKRNVEVGLNNILIFLQYQRKDGRFPGMISPSDTGIVGNYDWIQGFYFAQPALKMSYLIGHDRGYLEKLYSALEDFDDYLWTYRDSDGDGCLEVWCCWDTAEDNCTRYVRHGAPDQGKGSFGGETAPSDMGDMPMESTEFMNYSYACRDTLAKISARLNNGKEAYWREQAEKIRTKIKEYLWIPEKHACFYRDRNDNVVPCLDHSNLRSMYHGSFTQEMADEFLYYHLFNPDEFWTPCPITAIAANNPYFLNDPINNWSGPCQGLIYQRSVDAFHNYGHYTGAAVLGRHVVDLIRKHGVFHQQYDPFTGDPDPRADGYGPMIYAFSEYLSFLQGVNISKDEVHWSNAVGCPDSEYTQVMLRKEFTNTRKNGRMTVSIDGIAVASASEGLRLVTDLDGNVLRVICIDEISEGEVTVNGSSFRGEVSPNGIYEPKDGALVRVGGAKYFKPGVRPAQ